MADDSEARIDGGPGVGADAVEEPDVVISPESVASDGGSAPEATTQAKDASSASSSTDGSAFAALRRGALLAQELAKDKQSKKRSISECSAGSVDDSGSSTVLGKKPARGVKGRQRTSSLSAILVGSADDSEGGSTSTGSTGTTKRVKLNAPEIDILKIEKRMKDFGADGCLVKIDNKHLKCTACAFFFDGHKSHMADHFSSEGHKQRAEKYKENRKKQASLTDSFIKMAQTGHRVTGDTEKTPEQIAVRIDALRVCIDRLSSHRACVAVYNVYMQARALFTHRRTLSVHMYVH
jgi:hypothetical protein